MVKVWKAGAELASQAIFLFLYFLLNCIFPQHVSVYYLLNIIFSIKWLGLGLVDWLMDIKFEIIY